MTSTLSSSLPTARFVAPLLLVAPLVTRPRPSQFTLGTPENDLTHSKLLLLDEGRIQVKITMGGLAIRDCTFLGAMEGSGVVPKTYGMVLSGSGQAETFSACATERLQNVEPWKQGEP